MADIGASVLAKLKNKAKAILHLIRTVPRKINGRYSAKKVKAESDFSIVLDTINKFLFEPFAAVAERKDFNKNWNADKQSWQ